jgi:hypothetical protein
MGTQQRGLGSTVSRELAQLAPPLLVLVVLLLAATGWGTGHRELAAAALALGLTQVVPGVLVWRFVRPTEGWVIEDLVMGLAVGAALAVPTQVLSTATDSAWVVVAVPVVLSGVVLAIPRSRRRVLDRQTQPLPWLWGLATTATTVLPILLVLDTFRMPIRWKGWAVSYVDMHYHQALANELLHRFPPHNPQVADESLDYHWFTSAWTAQVSSVSGTPVDVLLWRFSPSLLAIVVPLLVAVVAMRLSRRTWVGPLASAIAFLLLDVAPWGISAISTPLHTTMSPTQQFGLLVMLPVLAIIGLRWTRQIHPASVLLLVPLLVVSGGSKGSVLPVVIAGCLLAVVAAWIVDRTILPTILLDTALAITAMLVLSVTMFGGTSGGISFAGIGEFISVRGEVVAGTEVDPATVAGVSAGLLFLLSVAWGSIGALGALFDPATRREPLLWMLLGCGISGFCAILFLTHPGESQLYFFFSAQVPLSILAAWGAAVLLIRTGRPVAVLLGGSATGAVALGISHVLFAPSYGAAPGLPTAFSALAVFVIAVTLGCAGAAIALSRQGRFTWRAFGAAAVIGVTVAGITPAIENIAIWDPVAPSVSAAYRPGATHSSEVRAYRWIRDHSSVDDVVMTNMHCRYGSGESCDHRHFAVAAYSERRVLVEGWAYTPGAARQYRAGKSASISRVPFWDKDLLALNDGFIEHPTAAAANKLRDLGVRWVAVQTRNANDRTLEPYARLRLRTDFVTVYELSS